MSDTNHPLREVLAAVFTVINVASVTDVAVGGLHNDYPEAPTYPWVRLSGRATPIGPIATDDIWECAVELTVIDQYRGDSRALGLVETIGGLLTPHVLSVSGWTDVFTALDDASGIYPIAAEDLNGVPTREWVMPYRVLVTA